jgi:hypothetical protein
MSEASFFPAKSAGFERFHDWYRFAELKRHDAIDARLSSLEDVVGTFDFSPYLKKAGAGGGQSAAGGTGSAENLTLASTVHATKGKIIFGTSAYDEGNQRLGVKTTSPSYPFHVEGDGYVKDAFGVGIAPGATGGKLEVLSSGLITRFAGSGTETQFHFVTNTGGTAYIWMVRLAGATPGFVIRDQNAGTEPFNVFPGAPTQSMSITTQGVGLGTATFGTSAVGVLAIKNGTAPTTGPADTVQFYSTDDAAGHTIPSFFCEGTNVLATGQADSASSTRVKVRINGTVVTLLGI